MLHTSSPCNDCITTRYKTHITICLSPLSPQNNPLIPPKSPSKNGILFPHLLSPLPPQLFPCDRKRDADGISGRGCVSLPRKGGRGWKTIPHTYQPLSRRATAPLSQGSSIKGRLQNKKRRHIRTNDGCDAVRHRIRVASHFNDWKTLRIKDTKKNSKGCPMTEHPFAAHMLK